MNTNKFILTLLKTGLIKVNYLKGKVFSYRYGKGFYKKGKRLLSGRVHNGYVFYHLTYKNKQKVISGHRLVWISKNGLPPKGHIIAHKNNIKHDNRLINLKAISKKQNSHEAYRDGLYRLNPNINYKIAKRIRKDYNPNKRGYGILSKKYKVSRTCIARIIKRKTWL